MSPGPLQFGLDTFGDVNGLPDGSLARYDEAIRNVVAQGVLADQVGVDAFGVADRGSTPLTGLRARAKSGKALVEAGGEVTDRTGLSAA